MTDARRPTFLRNFGRGAQARPAPDLADMGTAFALDEALEMGDYSTLTPGDTTPRMRGVAPVASWRLWLGRKLSP